MRRIRGWTRRETLQGAGAAAAAACVPSSGSRVVAGSDATVVDTVVFVMMENRSFDHWFGARKLLEGFEEEDGLDEGHSNPDAEGNPVLPFPVVEPCLEDPPHGWSSAHAQFNEGANDGFVSEYAARTGGDGAGVMAYQTRESVPISWALADAFRICDRGFCSVMSSTWPNRIYAHAGTSQGVRTNEFPEDSTLYTCDTIWRKASEAGIEWRYYYSDVPFTAVFSQGYDHDRCLLLDDFFRDAERGELPPISWVDPAFSYNDNHPPHHPALGELFLASIYEALANSPQWGRLLLVLTYDEHGGFFDHVPPPTCQDDLAADGFDQLGFRVPMVLVGPWVKQGVDHTVYDHTSWLKFLCDQHGITPWTTRIATANSLVGALDFQRMAERRPLPAVTLPAFSFDETTLPEECQYGSSVISQHIQRFAEFATARGFPVRLDPRAITAPLIRARAHGRLIG